MAKSTNERVLVPVDLREGLEADLLDVITGFPLFVQKMREGDQEIGPMALEDLIRLDSFVTAKRLQGLTRLTEGGSRRCRFANKVRTGATPHEQLSQFHPPIRFISDEVSGENASSTALLCIRVAEDARPGNPMRPGIYSFAVQRGPVGFDCVGLITDLYALIERNWDRSSGRSEELWRREAQTKIGADNHSLEKTLESDRRGN